MRGTEYTRYNICFLILLLIKSRLGLPTFNNLLTLFINMKTKNKTVCNIHILKKKDLNLFKIIKVAEKLYLFYYM